MRFALVLGHREDVRIPCFRHKSCCVIDGQAGVVADVGATDALGLIFVKLRRPFSNQIDLGKRWSSKHDHRQQQQETHDSGAVKTLHGHAPWKAAVWYKAKPQTK